MVKINDCLVNETETGLVFEWFNGDKKLTIYLDLPKFNVYFIKTESMYQRSDNIYTMHDLLNLFRWLNHG